MSKKNRNNYEVTENVEHIENEDLSESVEDAVEPEVQETEEHETLKSVPVKKYEVTAKEALNVRSSAKIEDNVVGIIGRGIIVAAPLVDGEVQTEGEFTYIVTEDGGYGFVMSKFLKEV
jgi:hypothetical protein